MNNNIKISIITPSYNQGNYIEDAILSVLNQNYDNFEHIIIDNCSTDNTVDIIKKYPHLVFVCEPDKGQSDAINKGFLKASGDIVAWLNADDFYLDGTFIKVVNKFNESPDLMVLYGDIIFIDQYKNVIRRQYNHKFDLGVLIYYGCFIPSTSTFFNQLIISENNLIDPEFHVIMDGEFFIRIAKRGYVFEYIPDVLAAFRWHGKNKSLLLKNQWKNEKIKIFQRYGQINTRNEKINSFIFTSLRKIYTIKHLIYKFIAIIKIFFRKNRIN